MLVEYGATEDRAGDTIQCGDRVLDGSGIRYVVMKIMPPHLLTVREPDGELVKILISEILKARWR